MSSSQAEPVPTSIRKRSRTADDEEQRATTTKRTRIQNESLSIVPTAVKHPANPLVSDDLHHLWLNMNFDVPEMASINGPIPGELEFTTPEIFGNGELGITNYHSNGTSFNLL